MSVTMIISWGRAWHRALALGAMSIGLWGCAFVNGLSPCEDQGQCEDFGGFCHVEQYCEYFPEEEQLHACESDIQCNPLSACQQTGIECRCFHGYCAAGPSIARRPCDDENLCFDGGPLEEIVDQGVPICTYDDASAEFGDGSCRVMLFD